MNKTQQNKPVTQDKKTAGKKKTAKKWLLLIPVILLIIYFAGVYYYQSHFLSGTILNQHDIGGKTVDAVKEILEGDLSAHTLTLKEREGKEEAIKGQDIAMKITLGDSVETALEKQNAFRWIFAFFGQQESSFEPDVSYDEAKLATVIDSLDCFQKENIVKPVNAKIELDGGAFKVIDEVYGTQVRKNVLTEAVKEALTSNKTTLDLEEAGAYKNPTIYADGEEVAKAMKKINKYMAVVMTYDFDYTTETVDKTLIGKWIDITDKMKVSLNYDKILAYVEDLAKEYDTYSTVRNFESSLGKTVKVYFGSYGWKISQTKEATQLIEVIQKGKSVTREPIYLFEAACRKKGNKDWGGTYAEVSIDAQQMWYYEKGDLKLSTSVVTGDPTKGRSTPTGAYEVMYKTRNVSLTGQGYSSPVSYWMPFDTNVGFHDATWRGSFGGGIYRGDGSHGCVNMPYYEAQSLYSMIEPGCPVFVY